MYPPAVSSEFTVGPTSEEWRRQIFALLIDRGVAERLVSTPAIAVERFAAGGGATAWYRLERPQDLENLVAHLRPGSDVRFAFGDAFSQGPFDARMAELVDQIGSEDINAVILARGDSFVLEHDFPSTAAEAAEFVDGLESAREVWVGRFPGGDRDVQVDLPDLDRVLRPHPH